MSGILQKINLGTAPDAGDGTQGPRAGGAIINAAIDSLDLVDVVPVSVSRTITNSDNRAYLHVDGVDVTLTWPGGASLTAGHITTVILSGNSQLTVAGSGGATFDPTGVVLANEDGYVQVIVVLHSTGGAFLVFTPGVPDTVTVMYAAGWPAERPPGEHVHAVGGAVAPTWLTAADVWFEEVV